MTSDDEKYIKLYNNKEFIEVYNKVKEVAAELDMSVNMALNVYYCKLKDKK